MLAGLNDVGQDSVRRITMRRSLLLGLVLSAAVFLLGLTWPSDAAARQRMRRPRLMNNRAVKAMNTAEVIHALRSAHALLIKADHDYDGHRRWRPKRFKRPSRTWGTKSLWQLPRSTRAQPVRPKLRTPAKLVHGKLRQHQMPSCTRPNSFCRRHCRISRPPRIPRQRSTCKPRSVKSQQRSQSNSAPFARLAPRNPGFCGPGSPKSDCLEARHGEHGETDADHSRNRLEF